VQVQAPIKGNNMHPNAKLIEQFYQAFQRLDGDAMCACYAEDVVFSDPVFPELRGVEAKNMWRMLTSRAQDFSLVFDSIEANDSEGSAHWVASYSFSQTGRFVVNDIHAKFRFKDGKIIQHRDHFDLWKWSRQAMGWKGYLLGSLPFVQNKIRQLAAKNLRKFSQK
jgi:ketosteroid isomerase-like protein